MLRSRATVPAIVFWGDGMAFTTITYQKADGIARITMARPAVMNAFSTTMRQELLEAVKQAIAEARVLVLTGEGRAFCAGQDLADALASGNFDAEQVLINEYNPLLEAITTAPIPVIAAVNGVAAGAGANLALACDVVIATESAVFLQAFTKVGLIPDAGGTWTLPRLVGRAQAMGQQLFAEKVSATDAARMGMIWEAVPDADFAAKVEARARQLASGPTATYARLKAALLASEANTLPQQLALEAKLQGECGASADGAEGILAFVEKRPTRFEGR